MTPQMAMSRYSFLLVSTCRNWNRRFRNTTRANSTATVAARANGTARNWMPSAMWRLSWGCFGGRLAK